MKSRKLLREILRELRGVNLPFSVCQNRHVKISVTNPENAQTAMLIIGVSPSDTNAEKASKDQCRKNLAKIGINVSCLKF
jgi:hypothetical protein